MSVRSQEMKKKDSPGEDYFYICMNYSSAKSINKQKVKQEDVFATEK